MADYTCAGCGRVECRGNCQRRDVQRPADNQAPQQPILQVTQLISPIQACENAIAHWASVFNTNVADQVKASRKAQEYGQKAAEALRQVREWEAARDALKDAQEKAQAPE